MKINNLVNQMFTLLSKDICIRLLTFCDCATLNNIFSSPNKIEKLSDFCQNKGQVFCGVSQNQIIETIHNILWNKYGKSHLVKYSHKTKPWDKNDNRIWILDKWMKDKKCRICEQAVYPYPCTSIWRIISHRAREFPLIYHDNHCQHITEKERNECEQEQTNRFYEEITVSKKWYNNLPKKGIKRDCSCYTPPKNDEDDGPKNDGPGIKMVSFNLDPSCYQPSGGTTTYYFCFKCSILKHISQ